MIDHELTDPAGGALTITHDHQGVWITATEGRDEVTVGPFPAHVLHETLDEAAPPDTPVDIAARVRRLLSGAGGMFGDYMDGGVTAAAIEAEVVSPERARSLVQERDEALTYAAETIATAQAETTAAVIAKEEVEVEVGTAIVRAEKAEQERDEALAFATLWKRTAREQVRRTRTIAGRTRVQADYIGRLRREVEKARQQGDVDPLPIIDEVARQDGVIHELRKQLEDVERATTASPRPVTVDDITDEMVERAWDRWIDLDPRDIHSMRLALRAALTPPPSRPEGAEKIEAIIADQISGDVGPATIRDLANRIATEVQS